MNKMSSTLIIRLKSAYLFARLFFASWPFFAQQGNELYVDLFTVDFCVYHFPLNIHFSEHHTAFRC